MSTRGSIFYHHDEKTGVTIHVYDEAASEVPQDIRLEIEFEHGTINVAWPKNLAIEDVTKLSIKSSEPAPQDAGNLANPLTPHV